MRLKLSGAQWRQRTNELYLLVNGGVGGGGGKARQSSLTLSAFNQGSRLMFNLELEFVINNLCDLRKTKKNGTPFPIMGHEAYC